MGGLVGRIFREFALTLSIAIAVSMAISLTTTPMLCALLLRRRPRRPESGPGPLARVMGVYERTLGWALRHSGFVILVLFGVVCLNIALFAVIPKGFFPQQSTGRLMGGMFADQSISFQLMQQKLAQLMDIVRTDPAVESVVGFTG